MDFVHTAFVGGRGKKIGVSLGFAPTLHRASRAALRLFSFGFAISFVNTQRVGPLCLVRVPLFLLLELTNDQRAEERERERERKREIERDRESSAQSSTWVIGLGEEENKDIQGEK